MIRTSSSESQRNDHKRKNERRLSVPQVAEWTRVGRRIAAMLDDDEARSIVAAIGTRFKRQLEEVLILEGSHDRL